MPKKPLTKQQKREQRKRKAAQWLTTYNGSHVVKAYRKKFNVGIECALRELEELGYAFTDQEKHNLCNGHDALLEQKQREKDRALLELAGDIMLHESTDLDFCESEEEILAVLHESGVTAPRRRSPNRDCQRTGKGITARCANVTLLTSGFPVKGIRRISAKPVPQGSKRNAKP
jgi:hypothetical protein